MQSLVNGLTPCSSYYLVHQGTNLPATVIQSQPNVLQSRYQYSRMLNTRTMDNVVNNAHLAGNGTKYNATVAQRDSQLASVSKLLRSVVNGSDFNNAVNTMKDIHSTLEYSQALVDGDILSSNISSRKIPSLNVNIPPPSMSGKGIYDIIPGIPNTNIPPPNNDIQTYGFCDNGLHAGSPTELPLGLHGLLNSGLHLGLQNNGLTYNGLQYGIQHRLHNNGLQLTCHNNHHESNELQKHFTHKPTKINSDRYGCKEVFTPPGYNPGQPPPQIGQKRSYEQMVQSSTSQLSTSFITNTSKWLSGTNGLVTAKTHGPNFHPTQMSNGTTSLHCTLCNVTCLDIETFEIHKQSKQHLCRASGQTTDALINRLNKTTEQSSTEPFCTICNRRYSGTLLNHQKGPEHKRKDRLTKRGCVLCQTGPYTTYPEYVQHIDSTEHKQQKDALQSEMKERESLGIAVNPAFICKPGPIKASQILQDALQKSAVPVVTLKENGITFHPPRNVSTNLISKDTPSSVVFNAPILATPSVSAPAISTPTITAYGKSFISNNIPPSTGVTSQSMSRLGPVRNSRPGPALDRSKIYDENIIPTVSPQGQANNYVTNVNTSHSSPTSPNKNIIRSSPTTRSYSPKSYINSEPYKASSQSLPSDISIAKPLEQYGVVSNQDRGQNKLVIVDKVGTCDYSDDVIPPDYPEEQSHSNTDVDLKCSEINKTHGNPSMQCDVKNDTTDNGRNFVVPVKGYYCSLCDVFYLDGDTPHCKSQKHIDMIKKMQCNGATNSTERSMSSVRNWIHKQLDNKEQSITEPSNDALERTEMVEVPKAASIPGEGVVIRDESTCSESRTDASKDCYTKDTCLLTENQDASLDPELSDNMIITQDKISQLTDCDNNVSN